MSSDTRLNPSSHRRQRPFLLYHLVFVCLLLHLTPSYVAVHGRTKTTIKLREEHGPAVQEIMEAAEIAYSAERPDIEISGSTQSVRQMIHDLYSPSPTVDMILMGEIPGSVPDAASDNLIRANTDITSFPVAGSAVVPVYNLPGLNQPLVLSRQSLVQLFLGEIKMWDDPILLALNPGLNLPHLNITVVIPFDPLIPTFTLTMALAAFDPRWETIVGEPSDTANWPVANYSSYVIIYNKGACASYVVSNPYSLSFSLISQAKPLGVQFARMINAAGQVVDATPNSIVYAFIEKGARKDALGQLQWQQYLIDGVGSQVWPITYTLECYLPETITRTTCAARTELVNFWLWYFGSPVVDAAMDGLGVTLVPPLLYTNLELNSFLRTKLKCGTEALESGVTNAIQISGPDFSSIYSDVLKNYLAYYSSLDNVYKYEYDVTSELQSIEQISAGEIDAALIIPQQFTRLYPDVLEPFLTDSNGDGLSDLVALPFTMYAIVPIYNLPTVIQLNYTNFPLIIDLDTLGRIYSTDITQWTHPSIEALNPGLSSAFIATGANPNITLVICCTLTSTAQPVSNAFVTTLNASSASFQTFTPWTLPISWYQLQTTATAKGSRTIMVDTEKQLESAVHRTSGAIGYMLNYLATQDSLHQFAVRRYTTVGTLRSTAATGKATTLLPTLDALQACGSSVPATLTAGYSAADIVPTTDNVDIVTQCWPLTLTASLILPSSYSGADCLQGNRTLNLINWLVTSDSLDTSANARGVMRLANIPAMQSLQVSFLNSIACDGETMLIILPKVWVLSTSVTAFAWAMCALGLFGILISFTLLVLYRQRSVLRSSSVPFQFVILIGLTLMFVATGLFGSTVSTTNCQSLAWIINIGFTLTFGPLFAKMWRIYKIFDRRILKVVKISNQKLGAMVAVLVGADIIINLVWQLYSPVYAQEFFRTENGRVHSYMHCSGDGNSLPFLLIISCEKFILLVFGSFMGFTTRNVASAFNESKNVAWAIYSVFFAVAIIVPVLFFADAIGDSFTVLIVFLLFWISISTLGFNFISKFILLFKDGKDGEGGSGSHQSGQDESSEMDVGASQLLTFPPIINLPKQMLDRYIFTLETQIKVAKARHKQLLEEGDLKDNKKRGKEESVITSAARGGDGGGANRSGNNSRNASLFQTYPAAATSQTAPIAKGFGHGPTASFSSTAVDSYRLVEDDVVLRSPGDTRRPSFANPTPLPLVRALSPSTPNPRTMGEAGGSSAATSKSPSLNGTSSDLSAFNTPLHNLRSANPRPSSRTAHHSQFDLTTAPRSELTRPHDGADHTPFVPVVDVDAHPTFINHSHTTLPPIPTSPNSALSLLQQQSSMARSQAASAPLTMDDHSDHSFPRMSPTNEASSDQLANSNLLRSPSSQAEGPWGDLIEGDRQSDAAHHHHDRSSGSQLNDPTSQGSSGSSKRSSDPKPPTADHITP